MFLHEIFWHCETKHFDKTVMTPPLCENFGCKDSFEKPKGSHTNFFRPVRQTILTELGCLPSLHESFWFQVLFQNTEGFPYEFFKHCETKKIWQKIVMPFPFSAIQNNISIPEIFWNDEWFPNEIFQCCETKIFRKNCDTPYYLSKFAVSVFFHFHKGSPTSFLGVMRHKEFFDRTVMSPPPSRPPLNDNFRHQKFFEIQMCSPTIFIISVKKKFNGEWWNPLLMHKILHTRNLLKYRTVTRRSLSALWDTKRIGKTRDAPPPYYARKFSIREFSRIRERLWYDFLRHYETKNFRPKIVIPPYYAWILFDTRKFLKHRSVTQCIFSPLWDKIFWQNPDAFPLLSMIFSYIKFFWNTDVFPQEFFRHCDTICFRRKIEITLPRPLFILKFFHYQRLSEKQKGSFMKFSGHERQKVFDKPVIHPTPMHEKILYQKSFEIQMCSPTNFIGVVKKIQARKVISSSYAWIFLYRKRFEIEKRSTRMFVGTMSQKSR